MFKIWGLFKKNRWVFRKKNGFFSTTPKAASLLQNATEKFKFPNRLKFGDFINKQIGGSEKNWIFFNNGKGSKLVLECDRNSKISKTFKIWRFSKKKMGFAKKNLESFQKR